MRPTDFIGIFLACLLANLVADRLKTRTTEEIPATQATQEPQTLEELFAQEVV